MLQIKELHFKIDNIKILKGINIRLASGLMHAIIGPNGSGKSTLLKNICNLWRADSGKVLIDNKDIHKIARKQLSKIVTFVPQHTSITFPITVKEMLEFGRYPYSHRFKKLSDKDYHIINNAMKEVDIEHISDSFINELSGGELQRVWLACALITQAPVMLLDEPTTFLDIKHKLSLLHLLKKLKEKGITIVVVIHELQYAFSFFDTVTILKNGYVHKTGNIKKVMSYDTIKEVFDVDTTYVKNNNKKILDFSLGENTIE